MPCFIQFSFAKKFFWRGGEGGCNSSPPSVAVAPLQAEWFPCNRPPSMCHIFLWHDNPRQGLAPRTAAFKVSCAHGCSGHGQACDRDTFPQENGNVL